MPRRYADVDFATLSAATLPMIFVITYISCHHRQRGSAWRGILPHDHYRPSIIPGQTASAFLSVLCFPCLLFLLSFLRVPAGAPRMSNGGEGMSRGWENVSHPAITPEFTAAMIAAASHEGLPEESCRCSHGRCQLLNRATAGLRREAGC